eukprot:3934190-Rhodomonas_salina.1
MSVACVFLPERTSRYGQHETDAERGDGSCLCHAMYGEPKPWGCVWMGVWQSNVRKAVQLRQRLQ